MTTPHLAPAQNAVREQFANPPSLESVTRQMLAAAIAQEYPTLKIDLARTRLAVSHSCPRCWITWAQAPNWI
jgi:alkylhydroperoxidase family enzyme